MASTFRQKFTETYKIPVILKKPHPTESATQKNVIMPQSPVINLLLGHSLIDLRHPSSTQLLDGGDIHGAVVEVARQTRHALLQEPSVLGHEEKIMQQWPPKNDGTLQNENIKKWNFTVISRVKKNSTPIVIKIRQKIELYILNNDFGPCGRLELLINVRNWPMQFLVSRKLEL